MRSCRGWLLIIWLLWGHASFAAAVSNAPLQALNAYIENASTCPEQLIEWNRKYNARTMAGETPRNFYYRVLGFQSWGQCGKRSFVPILNELQKTGLIFAKGLVSEAELEAKEAELITLFFAVVKNEELGERMVKEYETRMTARLIRLTPEKQYFDCTFFGDQPRCTY